MLRRASDKPITHYIITDRHGRYLAGSERRQPRGKIVWTLDESRAWFTMDYRQALFYAFLAEGYSVVRYAYE